MTLPDPVSIVGANFLFVAAALLIIVLNVYGKVGAKEVAIMCIQSGALTFITALWGSFVLGAGPFLAGFLLFAFTYFFYAFDILSGSDTTTGLGWYCLFVAVLCYPYAAVNLQGGAPVLAFFWALWGIVWGAFWVGNGLKKNIVGFIKFIVWVTIILNMIVGTCFVFGWMNFAGFK